MSLDLLSAFIIGLLGSGHCIAMCGGITTMLTSALPQQKSTETEHIPINGQGLSTNQQKSPSKVLLVTCYNIGRISSYCLIGAIVGYTGSIAAKNIGMPLAGLRMISAIFVILLGLYLGQWLMWLNRVEALGKLLWQQISPLAKKVIPVSSPSKAFSLGAIWGWLPCGLVYSTLTWALASGNAITGAAIMLFFGLGTLPALLTLSLSF
ncbi:MAG: sulfite exporter TauE/SafE family protein, partial [Colwellia sp.]|nr:sulfite exporter TauE/SafE family protein [Colwellia sp.]